MTLLKNGQVAISHLVTVKEFLITHIYIVFEPNILYRFRTQKKRRKKKKRLHSGGI